MPNSDELVAELERIKNQISWNDWCMAILCDPRFEDTVLTADERKEGMEALQSRLEILNDDANI